MRLCGYLKAGSVALLVATASWNLAAQTETLPAQDSVMNPHANAIATLYPGQLEPGLNSNHPPPQHISHTTDPASIEPRGGDRLDQGISHDPSQSVAAEQPSGPREIRYVDHSNPMEMQRQYARAGAKGYVMAFATINRITGRCTIHLPGHVSTGRYQALKKHWRKHCRRGDYHEPGEGIEANPDYGALLGAYADWLDGNGGIPGGRY